MNDLKIQCANCGATGHVYKKCNHPLISYGIICFRTNYSPVSKQLFPEYLLVQRKDSLSYVEFIRGKYNIDHKQYITNLFSNMTESERNNLKSKVFDELWKDLWQTNDCRGFFKEYSEAKKKFEMLRKGYMMKNEQNTLCFFNIPYILASSVSKLKEPEWGFPKGRRNINENDVTCALREFREETGINAKNLSIFAPCKPFEEVFSGSNLVRYKHVYYLAECNRIASQKTFNPSNKVQIREIKDMKWMNYTDAQAHIRGINIERKELFKRINTIITKNVIKFKDTQ